MNALTELQAWYAANCNGDWEHHYGVQIETLDNPGWSLKIDLIDTNLEGHDFSEINIQTTDDDWYFCHVTSTQFEGACDSGKLEVLIKTFLDWAKLQNDDWLKPPPPLTDEERKAQEDRQFFESLNEEVLAEACQQKDCSKNRIRSSVMCQEHHFEMVKKYRY